MNGSENHVPKSEQENQLGTEDAFPWAVTHCVCSLVCV